MSNTSAPINDAANVSGIISRQSTPTTSATVKPPPRLNYKKSKTGCQRCRARRVKCDEAHPICGNCDRHLAQCLYDRTSRQKPIRTVTRNEVGGSNFTSDSNGNDLSRAQESRRRRLLELKLLHHYMARTARTMPGSATVLARGTWHRLVPESALGNDGLLYMLYSLSALHMAKLDPQNQHAMDAYRTYFGMGLQEHSQDIRRVDKSNADAICLASSFVRIIAFAVLQDHSLDPYTSPMEWLEMTNGASSIFGESWPFIENDPNSIMWSFLRTPPTIDDRETLLAETNRQGLSKLLRRKSQDDPDDPCDEETRKAYELSANYVCGVQNTIAAKERTADTCRRLMAFPMLMPKRYIGLCKALDLRALVILAHYFALLAKLRDVWWIGDTGRREVRGIQTVLPPGWQDLIIGPLLTMEEKFLDIAWADELP